MFSRVVESKYPETTRPWLPKRFRNNKTLVTKKFPPFFVIFWNFLPTNIFKRDPKDLKFLQTIYLNVIPYSKSKISFYLQVQHTYEESLLKMFHSVFIPKSFILIPWRRSSTKMLPHFIFHFSSTFEIFLILLVVLYKRGKTGTFFCGSANCEKPVFLQFLNVAVAKYFCSMCFYTIQEHPVEISTKPDQRGVFSPPYNMLLNWLSTPKFSVLHYFGHIINRLKLVKCSIRKK